MIPIHSRTIDPDRKSHNIIGLHVRRRMRTGERSVNFEEPDRFVARDVVTLTPPRGVETLQYRSNVRGPCLGNVSVETIVV